MTAEQPCGQRAFAHVKHTRGGGCVYVFTCLHVFSLLVKMLILLHLRTLTIPTRQAHEPPIPTGAPAPAGFLPPTPSPGLMSVFGKHQVLERCLWQPALQPPGLKTVGAVLFGGSEVGGAGGVQTRSLFA